MKAQLLATRASVAAAPIRIEYSHAAGCLRAKVSGHNGSLETTVAYWTEIAGEVRRLRPGTLLVIDDMSGGPPCAADLQQFVDAMAGKGFEGVRIAYVEAHGDQIAKVEVGEILARERGYKARVFGDENQASLWLRHGET